MQWKKFRYRLEWLGVKALIAFIPLLSRRACASLARFVGSAVFRLDRKGREVTLANIDAALGDQYSREEQWRIGRESYQSFARTMLDLFWAPRLLRPDGRKYVEVIGGAQLDGGGCVVLCAHHAGVEWAGLVTGLLGHRGCVLTQAFKNPLLNKLFTGLRSSTGQEVITQEMSVLRMLRRAENKATVGLLLDLNIPPSQSATILDTFGMKMSATLLPGLLAHRTGARLVPMLAEPRPDGACRVTLHPPLEIPEGATPQAIAQIAWNFLEAIIREKPGYWMWGYKHWRYRPKGATRPYPFYAKESGKFEKLLRSEAGS